MPEPGSGAVPVVSFIGKSGSGKTTLLERVIAELTARGRRVATIKHHSHNTDVDVPGKDTWRHSKAGAREVVLRGNDVVAVFKKVDEPPDLLRLLEFIDDADIVLTEGFSREGDHIIEVSRAERSSELIGDPSELLAIVTDNGFEHDRVPMFGLDDVVQIADFVESRFLG